MTVRELIDDLEEFARTYGEDAHVVVSHDDGDEPPPSLSCGPTRDGSPATIRIF